MHMMHTEKHHLHPNLELVSSISIEILSYKGAGKTQAQLELV